MVIKFIRFLAVLIFCIPVLAITAIHIVAEFFIVRYYCLEMEMFRDFGDEEGMRKLASMAVDALSISPKQVKMLNESAGKQLVTIATTTTQK